MRWLALALLLAGCGHTEVPLPDAGARRLDEAVVLDGGRDAGQGAWCAPEGQPCWRDGWEYDLSNRCTDRCVGG